MEVWKMITLPETNSSHLKMDGWNIDFLLGWTIFRAELLVLGTVSFTHEFHQILFWNHQAVKLDLNRSCSCCLYRCCLPFFFNRRLRGVPVGAARLLIIFVSTNRGCQCVCHNPRHPRRNSFLVPWIQQSARRGRFMDIWEASLEQIRTMQLYRNTWICLFSWWSFLYGLYHGKSPIFFQPPSASSWVTGFCRGCEPLA